MNIVIKSALGLLLALLLTGCNTTTVIVKSVPYTPENYEGVNNPDTIKIIYGSDHLKNY